MAQLENMPGLVKGIATSFRKHLTSIENHPTPMININLASSESCPRSTSRPIDAAVNLSLIHI